MVCCAFCGEKVDNDLFCCHSCGNPLPFIENVLKEEHDSTNK